MLRHELYSYLKNGFCALHRYGAGGHICITLGWGRGSYLHYIIYECSLKVRRSVAEKVSNLFC